MQKTSDFGVAAEKQRSQLNHVKLIIPQIAAIADFEQRWRQRGKTYCGFKIGVP